MSSTTALVVIDIQNDYFEKGLFPLWNAENTLKSIEIAISQAYKNNIPVILIQHIADNSNGMAPFFNQETIGAEIHPRILVAAPNATIIIKKAADSFFETNLDNVLKSLNIKEILLCGMMTQNCVNHTALAKETQDYKVKILSDCCTSTSEIIHKIALRAVSTRVELVSSTDIFN